MPTAITIRLGQGTVSALQFKPIVSIVGKGVHLGDAANDGQANHAVTQSADWGWSSPFGEKWRCIPIWSFDIGAQLGPGVEILSAILHLYQVDTGGLSLSSANIPAGGFTLGLHAIRRAVTASATWRVYDTALAWTGDYGPDPGFDYVTTALDTRQYTTTDFANFTASGNRYELTWDVTAEAQYAANGTNATSVLPMRLLMPVVERPVTTTAPFLISWDNPSGSNHVNNAHTYLEVIYRPAVSVFGSTTGVGRPIDLTNMLNPLSADENDWLDGGDPQQNSASTPEKYYMRSNKSGGTRRRVVIAAGRADVSSVDNAGSVSGKTLRSVDPFDNNGTSVSSATEGTVSGALRIIPDSGDLTKYKVYFTPASTGVEGATPLAEHTTAATSVTFAADHTFDAPATTNKMITIRAVKWSATAANTADVWRATTRGDLRPNAYDVSGLGLVRISPDTAPGSDVADETRDTIASHAFAQQFWAAPHDVASKTQLRMRNSEQYAVDDWLDVSDATCTYIVRVQVETVFPSTHGTYPDELGLTTAITLANFPDGQGFVAAVVGGNLTAPKETYLTAAAASGAVVLTVNAAFTGSPSELTIVDLATGLSDTLGIDHQTGNNIYLTTGQSTSRAYPVGSRVAATETDSSEPFYVHSETLAGTALGQYLWLLRTYELAVT